MKSKARPRERLPREESSSDYRREQFVLEYVVDFNGTQAAIRAGYSKKTAGSQANRLLKNADIQAAVKKAVERRQAKTRRTAEEVEQELDSIAFSRITDFVEYGPDGVTLKAGENLRPDQIAAIAEVSEHEVNSEKSSSRQVKFKLHDKLGALRTKAEILKMLKGDAPGEVQRVEIIIKG